MTDRNALIESCIMDLRRYALALCRDRDQADDLVQDTVARALSRWYLRKAGNEVRPWLFAIQRNLFLSGRRRDTRGLRIFDPDSTAEGVGGGAPDAALELRQALAMIDMLPEDQRSAVMLVSVEGFSYREAAKIMATPVGTVMSRLSRGRARLRQLAGPARETRLRRVK